MKEGQDQPPAARVKKRKEKTVLEHIPENGHAGNSRFARALASNDYGTREKGLQALSRFLIRKHDISEPDMLKIWKGLFYAFWHSDLAPVQIALAERLAGILPQMADEAGYLYFTVFLTSMRREWFGIDRLRLDKFLMLIRRFVAQLFELLRSRGWQAELVACYAAFLRDRVLMPTDTYKAIGLAYHVADVFLPELEKVVQAAHDKGAKVAAPPAAALAELLQPFVLTLAVAGDAASIRRFQEAVFQPLVEELQVHSSAHSDKAACCSYSMHLDVVELATRLFDLGAAASTRARNREALYGLSMELEKTTRKRQKTAHSQQQQQHENNSKGGAQGAPASGPSSQDQFTFSSGLQETEPAPLANATLLAANQLQQASASGKKRKARHSVSDAAPAPVESDVGPASTRETAEAATPTSSASAAPAAALALAATAPSGSKKKKKRSSTTINDTPLAVQALADDGVPMAAADDSPVFGLCTANSPGDGPQPASTSHAPPSNGRSVSSKPSSQQRAALRATMHKAAAASFHPHIGHSLLPHESTESDATTPSLKQRRRMSIGQQVAVPRTSGKSHRNGGVAGQAVADGPLTPLNGKKGVTIDLSKNLFFAFGGPKAPPEVRTPPTARSKGGILKAKSAYSQPPASAPPKLFANSSGGAAAATVKQAKRRKSQGSQQVPADQQLLQLLPAPRFKVTPSSVPRARAGLFF